MITIEKNIDLVSASYGKISLRKEFFDKFYDIFMGSHPDIRPMFAKTDFLKQKKLLKNGLSYMILFAKDMHTGKTAVENIARIHDKENVNVPPELYPYWIDSLIKTIKLFDTEFTEETEAAWREIMGKGINKFIEMY
ncbi:MAG: globin [Spirochaetia bacterium]|nr:globin [Spirochaetia bacterium]